MAICTVGHLRALIILMEAFDSHPIVDATNSALPLLLLLLRSDIIIIIAMITITLHCIFLEYAV